MTGRRPVLDPATRLGEILFGLIMVLSFTGSIQVATAGRAEIRELLVAALGCNLAWGIVDAVMYLMNDLLERNGAAADLRALHAAPDPAAADRILAEHLPRSVVAALGPADLASLRERLLREPVPPGVRWFDGRTLLAAAGVFLLVFGATFPAAAPFLFLDDAATALRVSNTVALAIMFAAGAVAGRRAGVHPVVSGFVTILIGGCLVGLTMLLGG